MTELAASPPVIEEVLSGYRMHWIEGQEEALIVEVKHVQTDSHGGMIGEVSVWHNFMEQDKPTLSGVRLNLFSEQRRTAVAKRLTAVVPTFPWDSVIEQVCHEVIERVRAGDPGQVIEPVDDDDPARPEYVLEPVIMRHLPSVIYGDKGVHKTTLALLFAGIIFLPWSENTLGFITNGHPAKVALLDYESGPEVTKYTLQRLRKGTDIPYFVMAYRRCTTPLADDIEAIAKFLDKNGINVVIIDSLGAATGSDLMKPEPALRFFEALRKLNITSLIIAQNSKGEEGKKTIFGSTYFTYYARNIFELKRFGTEETRDESCVVLIHRESNYSGKYAPMGFQLNFTPNSIAVKTIPVNYSQLLDKVDRQKQILELITNTGGINTQGIVAALRISRAQADNLVHTLRGKNEILKLPNGNWARKSKDSI
jgi:hypothetical protein